MIGSIKFSLMNPKMVKKLATVEVNRAELYDNDGFPVEGGVMDPRLGVIDPGLRCRTCGNSVGGCFGHFGFINLVRPVVHVLYSKIVFKILKSICNECSRALTSPTSKKCSHCGAEQVPVKFEKPYTYLEGEKTLTPIETRERLEKIPDGDLEKLEFKGGRPEWLILSLFPIPPVIMRPSITLETGERSEDDLTHKMVDIIRINQRLGENIEIGAPDFIIEDLWELLQYHTATYFDNRLAGIPAARHRSGRPLKTLADRLKSKEGRFRQNLAGKRVNFSARTVISPDPYISINEVGIPISIAKDLTIPISVGEHNLKEIKILLKGAPNWPSANYIIRPDGRRKKITNENRDDIIKEVSPGYIVDRHSENGDFVLFNRQPSLHRMSIMAHKIRVTPWRTFTINPTVCPPYNADFDGDEMNLHVLQTDEARAEAELLMDVSKHIRSPRFGGPIIGCEHDHISGIYLLSRDGTILTRKEAFQLLSDIGVDVDLPNKKTFTGKEVISYILPKGLYVEFKSKADPNGDPVLIENGQLKKGIIDKNSIGRDKGFLIDRIEREYGSKVAHTFIDRISLLGIVWLEKVGFTIGLDDVQLTEKTQKKISNETNKAKEKVRELIEEYHKGRVDILPGRGMKESLEFHILKMLGDVSEVVGNIVSAELKENCAVIMAKSGARGSMNHISQLSGLLGQEKALGERVKRGYRGRTLSHFKIGDLSPEGHGFVSNNFKVGLTPHEFFFDVMSGREGLMDKSLRTRHSGYLERRLMNALQDLKIEYDGTVRDNNKTVIQFISGEDNIDPAKSDWGKLNIKAILMGI